MEDINRLKVVLAEKKRTAKWLATEIGKDPATISKWCTNTTQPSLEADAVLPTEFEGQRAPLLIAQGRVA